VLVSLQLLAEAELGLVWPGSPAYRLPENRLARELAEYWEYLGVGLFARSELLRAAAEDRLGPFEEAIAAVRRLGRSPWGEIVRCQWAAARQHPAAGPEWLAGPARSVNAKVASGRWSVDRAAGAVPGPGREHRDLVAELARRGFGGVRGWSW
jgi:hypothetical protein